MSSPLAVRAARKSVGVGNSSAPFSSTPRTPRPRFVHEITPENTRSSSASTPFNWNATRGGKAPVYSTPLRMKQMSNLKSPTPSTPRRVIRKKSMRERLQAIPSDIMFQISLFPDNVPLPEPTVGARFMGGLMHFLHFCVRISSSRKAEEEAVPWDDYSGTTESWFDWTIPVSTALLLVSLYTAFRLFTTFKSYDLHLQKDPVASPRASFVSAKFDREPVQELSVSRRVFGWVMYSWSASWRFLFNMKSPVGRVENFVNSNRVQQLNVWNPGEFDLQLFAIYSPVHALLWMATGFSNWILMFIIMGVVGTQTFLLISSYKGLVKDKSIIASEVLHEYNEKFVNPRVFPIRHDKAIMTNQAEFVDGWN